MADALIIDACRTPRGVGKAGKGALSGIHPQQLGATVPARRLGRYGGASLLSAEFIGAQARQRGLSDFARLVR